MAQMNDYQKYIHASRYARWIPEKNRRETWEETVDRLISFWVSRYPNSFPKDELRAAIVNLEIMPSMRSLMTAGKALELDEIAGYNCSFVAVDHPRVFDEIMYILMCGTGVGFSVEGRHVAKLPEVAEEFHNTETVITIKDSKIGWASGFRELVQLLYAGLVPKWDVSKVRPAGARLKTFGGRASGPEPLVDLFRFSVDLFKRAAGRKLNTLECHDLVCKIADIVVVGGVRRSALISLSDLEDHRVANAKNGQWWETDGQRALANNSVAYTEKPDISAFMREWGILYESKSGERGIFNRVAAKNQCIKSGRREFDGIDFGTNPCGEIILRPNGLCNLSEVVVRAGDTAEDLARKVRLAAILGTFQSTLTNFRYVRSIWKKNAEDERLLGVSLTGIMDNTLLTDFVGLETLLEELKNVAIQTNSEYAKTLGIAPAAAITTVKPSGTVSQLVDSASGIHPRYSKYYIRRVRADKKDPLGLMLKEQGIHCEDDCMKPDNMWVFSFPMRSPDGSITREEVDATYQLEHYKIFQKHWCEHNPSITVYYRDEEFLDVGAWVFKNFDNLGGVSFLPHTDHVYKQAPYEEITEEQYNALKDLTPVVDWSMITQYETEDTTDNVKELSCSAGVCEIN
jgi:ribonucleoside-diphosphate reductase alpha chain